MEKKRKKNHRFQFPSLSLYQFCPLLKKIEKKTENMTKRQTNQGTNDIYDGKGDNHVRDREREGKNKAHKVSERSRDSPSQQRTRGHLICLSGNKTPSRRQRRPTLQSPWNHKIHGHLLNKRERRELRESIYWESATSSKTRMILSLQPA